MRWLGPNSIHFDILWPNTVRLTVREVFAVNGHGSLVPQYDVRTYAGE